MVFQPNRVILDLKNMYNRPVKLGHYFSSNQQNPVLLKQILVELNQDMIITCQVSLFT